MPGVPRIQRSSNSRTFYTALALLGCLTHLGCGMVGSEPAGKVQGILKHNGEPAAIGTSVMFLMSAKGLGAVGEVEEDGKFVVKMAGTDQIPLGTYTVSVRPSTGPELTPEEQMAVALSKKAPVDYESSVPKKYRTPESSGLTFEVKAGENLFELDMKDE